LRLQVMSASTQFENIRQRRENISGGGGSRLVLSRTPLKRRDSASATAVSAHVQRKSRKDSLDVSRHKGQTDRNAPGVNYNNDNNNNNNNNNNNSNGNSDEEMVGTLVSRGGRLRGGRRQKTVSDLSGFF